MNAPTVRAASELPVRVEICARDRDGVPCLGTIFRPTPTPDMPYCVKCGAQEPGVAYVRESAAA